MHHPSVSWHKTLLKYCSWNIICFGQKEPINVHFIQNFKCSNESSPNSSCHLWNHKVRVYSNFASLFTVMKNNISVFFSWNLTYFGQKELIEVKFPDFWVAGWKFTKFLSYLKPQVRFFVSLEITLVYFFSWNFIWSGQKETIKAQNFRLLTAHVKFHQICTLIGSFYWKYIKFQLENHTGVTSHDMSRVIQNLKKNHFVVSKMTRIWWILIRALKYLKLFHFDWSLSCKVYNVWPKKVLRIYLSWQWRTMQNLKKNWLVIWKMTWGIWQIFTSV